MQFSKSFANSIIDENIGEIERQIKGGADVNEIDDYGFTPLIESAVVDNIEIAKLLLNSGAKINEPDLVGSTALHWAVDNSNLQLCKLLLERGANANAYTKACQPILMKPLLRRQNDLKQLLYRYGADLKFAQDYINTKLIGHRYELWGRVDIVDNTEKFIELDFEGFIPEFTVDFILSSLAAFKNNYSARHLRSYFADLQTIIDAFMVGSELNRYKHYLIKHDKFKQRLTRLFNNDLLLLSVGYEGHAITFVKYKNILAKCDRGENSRHEPSVVFYKIHHLRALTDDFLSQLIYKPQNSYSVSDGIKKALGLEPIAYLPLSSQQSGNCSWANIEAAVPTMLMLLKMAEHPPIKYQDSLNYQHEILDFYQQWLVWDKDRALYQCIENFYSASPARKASIAAVLAAVLFQRCRAHNPADVAQADKILPVLLVPEYQYVLTSYLTVYVQQEFTEAGKNLLDLLDVTELGPQFLKETDFTKL